MTLQEALETIAKLRPDLAYKAPELSVTKTILAVLEDLERRIVSLEDSRDLENENRRWYTSEC